MADPTTTGRTVRHATTSSPAGKRGSHSPRRNSVATRPPDPTPSTPGDLPPILDDLTDHVVGLERIPGHLLVPNRRNVRKHPVAQQKLIDRALRAIGVSGALLGWRKEPGGAVNLIDGHARVALAPQHLWPVLILDVDQRKALSIALTFDRMGRKAETAAEELDSISDEVGFMDELLSADIEEWRSEVAAIPYDPDPSLSRHVEFEAEVTASPKKQKDAPPDGYDHVCPECGHGWDD